MTDEQIERVALKPCPFCGEAPDMSTYGTWIEIDCCASMSFQKCDYLTIEERNDWSDDRHNYSEAVEAKVLAIASKDWNTRAIEAASEWLPIESAPRDGTIIDVWLGTASEDDIKFYCNKGTRRSTGWAWEAGKFRPCEGLPIITIVDPTHWMPLPTPPAQEGK